ncbi:hypothetical protein HanIR_Chr11g0559671 [Helianthus annuus]|nr:hypothetical protein HanIR_Chr11g0559671 [Helianthus annuus]
MLLFTGHFLICTSVQLAARSCTDTCRVMSVSIQGQTSGRVDKLISVIRSARSCIWPHGRAFREIIGTLTCTGSASGVGDHARSCMWTTGRASSGSAPESCQFH